MTIKERILELIKTLVIIGMILFIGLRGHWEVAYVFGYFATVAKIWIEHTRPNFIEILLFAFYPATLVMTVVVLLFFPDMVEEDPNNPSDS